MRQKPLCMISLESTHASGRYHGDALPHFPIPKKGDIVPFARTSKLEVNATIAFIHCFQIPQIQPLLLTSTISNLLVNRVLNIWRQSFIVTIYCC